MKIVVIIPTYNAGVEWSKSIEALKAQKLSPKSIFVIDSGSEDKTLNLARHAKFDIQIINKLDFNHGKTRQLAVDLYPSADIFVFLTQDAILGDLDSLEKLVKVFKDDKVGLAYGRQLPRPYAGILESHARHFNYPARSTTLSLEDKDRLGMKVAFTSNSFAAYRASALRDVGGFPADTIVSEDMYVAAKMLTAGWKIAYVSEATVYHSHGYSLMQEFQRYFDIGVFNARESWIRQEFGEAEAQGMKFVRSEMGLLIKKNPLRIPEALLRTFFKLAGYRLGLNEANIPVKIKRKFSMQKTYWH